MKEISRRCDPLKILFYLLKSVCCLLLDKYKCLLFVCFKGDYDVVINDYEKAKSLFGKTEVQVFKKCKISVLLFAAFFFFNLKAKKHIVV